ncbi:MAG: hypothetical protein NZM43_11495 [Saprospiraceae bacterium]|nr:hypothetical protein [Saprospiraceae bacterium]MDW8484932.1 hypothetical protein [Saprospiraceae bacterium]
MRLITLNIITIFIFPSLLLSQERSTADYILDGGRLLLEVFREARKKDKNKEANEELLPNKPLSTPHESDEEMGKAESSFCFANKTETILKVELRRRNKVGGYHSRVYESVISPGEMECALALSSGVYTYKVMQVDKDNKTITIKQGDIQLDEKTQLRKGVD